MIFFIIGWEASGRDGYSVHDVRKSFSFFTGMFSVRLKEERRDRGKMLMLMGNSALLLGNSILLCNRGIAYFFLCS